jgi:hypothetical protein
MMKKFHLLALLVLFTISCSVLGVNLDSAAPVVDTQATIDAKVRQSQVQTQAAQPTPTTVPPTDTVTPVVVSSPSPTMEAVSEGPTSTSIPNLTTTPATATAGTLNPTFTANATQPASSPGGPTLTPTLGVLKYGTLPPAVPSAGITIFNKSKAQAYISLQNDAIGRPDAVLEYPVKKEVRVQAPLGYYLYVVWVGGRQIVGEFYLNQNDDITITIFKDEVVVK